MLNYIFPEVHVEQVKVVVKNQHLVIRILKQSKIRASRSSCLELSKWLEKIGACNSTPDRKENKIPAVGLFVLTGSL